MGRYIELKGEHGERMILDTKTSRVICTCQGYYAPIHSEEIVKALEAYHQTLYEKFLPQKSSH